MRNFFLCILIFFGSGGFHDVLSYNDDLPKKPEELKQVLETAFDDHVKLEIYWHLYKALKSTDKPTALVYLDTLEALAAELDEHEYLGKAHHGKALFHKRDDEYGKAISEYLVAIDHYTLSRSYTPLANDLNNIGVIFLEVEDYSYATEFFQKAQEHYLETGNKFSAMITHMNLGTCFLKRNEPDLEKAMEHFLEALDLNQVNEKNQTYYFYKINNHLGALFYQKGELRKAIEHYRTSQRYVSTLDDPVEKEMILIMNIGEALTADGRLEEAEAMLQKAIDKGESSEIISEEMVECYNIMGELKQRQNKHREAITFFERGIAIASKSMVNPSLQKALNSITISFDHLIRNGDQVGDRKMVAILMLKMEQEQLMKQFDQGIKLSVTQDALRKQVQISGLEKNLTTSRAQVNFNSRMALIISIFSIGLIVTIIAIMKVYRPIASKKLIANTYRILKGEDE